jgi:hypothetical protein
MIDYLLSADLTAVLSEICGFILLLLDSGLEASLPLLIILDKRWRPNAYAPGYTNAVLRNAIKISMLSSFLSVR